MATATLMTSCAISRAERVDRGGRQPAQDAQLAVLHEARRHRADAQRRQADDDHRGAQQVDVAPAAEPGLRLVAARR